MIQKNLKKSLKPWEMGTHLTVLSESFPMNTNMTCLDVFQKSLCSCDLDVSSLSIGRVKERTWHEKVNPSYSVVITHELTHMKLSL